MTVRPGIILRPERHPLPPVAVEAAPVAIVPAAAEHHAREHEFGSFVKVLRDLELRVFHARVLPKRLLKGVDRADTGEHPGQQQRGVANILPHGLDHEHSIGTGQRKGAPGSGCWALVWIM